LAWSFSVFVEEMLAMNVAELKSQAQRLPRGAMKYACTAALASALVLLGAVEAKADSISPSITIGPTPVSSIAAQWPHATEGTQTPHPTTFTLTGASGTVHFNPSNAQDPGPFNANNETVDVSHWTGNGSAVSIAPALTLSNGSTESATFSISHATLSQTVPGTGTISASLQLQSSNFTDYNLTSLHSIMFTYTGITVSTTGQITGFVGPQDDGREDTGFISFFDSNTAGATGVITTGVVPEPGSLALVVSGVIGMAGFGWWSRRPQRLQPVG
jgi:hypothetical protein